MHREEEVSSLDQIVWSYRRRIPDARLGKAERDLLFRVLELAFLLKQTRQREPSVYPTGIRSFERS